jgi:hypothetical protein
MAWVTSTLSWNDMKPLNLRFDDTVACGINNAAINDTARVRSNSDAV